MAHVEDRWHTERDGLKERTDLYGKCRRWRVRWRLADGSHRSKSFDAKADADRYARDIERRHEQGDAVDPSRGRITVADWGQTWLDTMRPPITKPKTYETYESLYRTKIQTAWGSTSLAGVTNADVRVWIADLGAKGLSASTIRKSYFLLAEILDAAVADERIAKNRARGVKLPPMPPRPRHRYLSHEEVTRLWTATGHPLVPFLAYTGLRWSEAVGLRWDAVDLDRRHVWIGRTISHASGAFHVTDTKNHRDREIVIPETLAAIMRDMPRPTDHVFTSPTGKTLRGNNFQRGVLTPGLRVAGIEHLSPHDLRHTAASLAVQAGANVLGVARMLGHSDPSITLRIYADLFPEDLEAVAERLDTAIAASRARPRPLRAVT